MYILLKNMRFTLIFDIPSSVFSVTKNTGCNLYIKINTNKTDHYYLF